MLCRQHGGFSNPTALDNTCPYCQMKESLCDRFGHPVYPALGEEIVCPRCGKKVVNPETLLSKVTKTDLGNSGKNTFTKVIKTEEIS